MEQKRGSIGGRPTVISKEKVENLYKYLKIGSYPETAETLINSGKRSNFRGLCELL